MRPKSSRCITDKRFPSDFSFTPDPVGEQADAAVRLPICCWLKAEGSFVIIPTMSLERARKIKLLLFDVDGVLTDGTIWLFPAPAGAQLSTHDHARQHAERGGFAFASQTMVEAKGFHAHDGTAISLARLAGLKTGLITKRISETVALRARDLKLDHVRQGIQDKLSVFREI